jgi:chromosome segregation ATPase
MCARCINFGIKRIQPDVEIKENLLRRNMMELVKMELVKMDVNSDLDGIEQSLQTLSVEFAHYNSRLKRASERVHALSARIEGGFSNPERSAIYEETLNCALREYFQLREKIERWTEQVRQIVILLNEIEHRAALMSDDIPALNQKSMFLQLNELQSLCH